MVSIPTQIRLGVMSKRQREKEKTLCDDTFFLKQVEDHVRQKVLDRLQEVCGDSLYCDVADLEAICGEVLGHRQVWTNEIFRKKRSTGNSALELGSEGTLVTTSIQDGKQTIEVSFRVVGRVYMAKLINGCQVHIGREWPVGVSS